MHLWYSALPARGYAGDHSACRPSTFHPSFRRRLRVLRRLANTQHGAPRAIYPPLLSSSKGDDKTRLDKMSHGDIERGNPREFIKIKTAADPFGRMAGREGHGTDTPFLPSANKQLGSVARGDFAVNRHWAPPTTQSRP